MLSLITKTQHSSLESHINWISWTATKQGDRRFETNFSLYRWTIFKHNMLTSSNSMIRHGRQIRSHYFDTVHVCGPFVWVFFRGNKHANDYKILFDSLWWLRNREKEEGADPSSRMLYNEDTICRSKRRACVVESWGKNENEKSETESEEDIRGNHIFLSSPDFHTSFLSHNLFSCLPFVLCWKIRSKIFFSFLMLLLFRCLLSVCSRLSWCIPHVVHCIRTERRTREKRWKERTSFSCTIYCCIIRHQIRGSSMRIRVWVWEKSTSSRVPGKEREKRSISCHPSNNHFPHISMK